MILALLAALTIDSTTCSGGVKTGCPVEHMISPTNCTIGTTNTCTFPNSISAAGANTFLIALVSAEDKGGGTTNTITSIAAGTGANYSTTWTLVPNSRVQSANGASASFYAITARAFSGEVPVLTAGCTGGTNCTGTSTQEMAVQVVGYSAAFPLPGNAGTCNSAGAAPSVSLTTSSGDTILFTAQDSSGAHCTATPSPANSTVFDTFQTVAGASCGLGNSDWYAASGLTSTASAGTTTIGFSETTFMTCSAVEICDSTAAACPNIAAGSTQPYQQRNRRGH